MPYTHLLLEVHCMYGINEESELEKVPDFCKVGVDNPGYHCIKNMCRFAVYTDAPFEIAYAGEFGQVPDYDAWVGFGGDMEPENIGKEKTSELLKLWEEICRKKVGEAYKEYMEKSGLKKTSS